MKNYILGIIRKVRTSSEDAMTLIEMVIAIALVGMVATFTTATVLNTTNTSDNFTTGVENESNLLDAVSLISRDVSLVNKFNYAGEDALAMITTDGGVESKVFYFHWKNNASSIPDDAAFNPVRSNISKLPDKSGIVEYRIVNNDNSSPIIRNLIPGYNPGGGALNSLFTYHNADSEEILLESSNPVRVSSDKLTTIRRVELHFTSYIEGRSNAMEMHTSAVPRLLGFAASSQANGGNVGDVASNSVPSPSVNGKLTPKTDTATVWWGGVSGATSYELFSRETTATGWNHVKDVDAKSGVITENVASLKWGSDYEFKVVAFDHRGPSPDSNVVTMRVTPEPTKFVNVDSKRGQNSSDSTSGWTVARNLNNALAWQKSNGAKTKYLVELKRDTVSSYGKLADNLTNLVTTDSGKTYGDQFDYKVTAYNDEVNIVNPDGSVYITGGKANASSAERLISPPIAPTITVTTHNDIDDKNPKATPRNDVKVNNIGSITTEKGIVFKSGESNKYAQSYVESKRPANTSTWQDDLSDHANFNTNRGWGTKNYYYAYAYNDAGDSLVASSAAADQPPGPIVFHSLDNTTGYGYLHTRNPDIGDVINKQSKGTLSGSWNDVYGAGKYDMERKISDKLSRNTVPLDFMDAQTGVSNLKNPSFSVKNTSPGVIYTVTVTATAKSNTRTRAKASTVLTKPDVPQSGILEAMCLSDGAVGTNQTFAMYVEANTVPRYGYADQTKVVHTRTSGGSGVPPSKTEVADEHNVYYMDLPGGIGDVGKVTLTNIISAAAISGKNIDFGTSEAERTSIPAFLHVGYEATFGVGCDAQWAEKNNKVPAKIPQKNGYSWVVHQYVCYGYKDTDDYGNAWIRTSNPYKRGYWTSQKNEEIAKGTPSSGWSTKFNHFGTRGCIWRTAPTGQEPRFTSDLSEAG